MNWASEVNNTETKTKTAPTYPFIPETILCRSFLHSSQKYSSGLMASSKIPTQPPCCHTLQESHWMKRLPASSDRISEAAAEWPNSSWMPDFVVVDRFAAS